MKSFFALSQKNRLDRQRWTTRQQLRIAIVTWIEPTYHRRRRQAALGRPTPHRVRNDRTPNGHAGHLTRTVTCSCSSPYRTREDGCTYLAADDGQRWLPVFPADSAWVDGALVFGSTTHPLDESVTLTGGEASSQYLDGLSGVPTGCDRSLPGWVIVA